MTDQTDTSAEAVERLDRLLAVYEAVWGDEPSIAPHIERSPGVTTGQVIGDTMAARETLRALAAERDQLRQDLAAARANKRTAVRKRQRAAARIERLDAQNTALRLNLAELGHVIDDYMEKVAYLRRQRDDYAAAFDAAEIDAKFSEGRVWRFWWDQAREALDERDAMVAAAYEAAARFDDRVRALTPAEAQAALNDLIEAAAEAERERCLQRVQEFAELAPDANDYEVCQGIAAVIREKKD